MNNSSPYEAYVPSMMSFVGLESSTHKQLWDCDANSPVATAAATTNPVPFLSSIPFLDCPSSLLPLNNLPFYPEYPTAGFVKMEDQDYSPGQLGLNLGHRTYFSSGDAAVIDRLFRRTRGLYQLSHQVPRCLAEGCKADLSEAKHYHRRHKVCEFHSKATVVIAGGVHQRFCQQCSRFHLLSEFDEAKRSCRKRLADHNRRRRKPQPQKTTDSSFPKSLTSSPMEESSQTTTKSTADIYTATKGTSNITTINTSLERQREYHNKATQYRNGPSLSLGGAGVVEKGGFGSHTSYNDHQQKRFSSSSSPSTAFLFHSHNLFCSSSNEASQSTNDGGSDPTNHLQLGQGEVFEVMDFM